MATSLFRKELSDLCVWTETIQAQAHLHIDPDSINIALQLLLKLDIQHAYQLDYYYVGCIYIALKFFDSDNDVKYVLASDFLQLFNPYCDQSESFMTMDNLFKLEKDILKRVNYHIPTAGDPILVIQTVGLERYLTLPAKAKLKMFESMVHYDYMIQHTPHTVSGCKLVSSMRLLAFHILFAPSLLDRQELDRKLAIIQSRLKKLTLSPFFFTICQLYYNFIQHSDNISLLSKVLNICEQRQVDLSNPNPVLEVLYYPSMSSWLRHTDVNQRKSLIQNLIHFDQVVRQHNPCPSSILSRCQLLLMYFVIQTRQKRPRLGILYKAVEDVVKEKQWYDLSYKLRPTVYNILHLVMTPLKDVTDDVLNQLWTDLKTLFIDEKINLLKSGCY